MRGSARSHWPERIFMQPSISLVPPSTPSSRHSAPVSLLHGVAPPQLSLPFWFTVGDTVRVLVTLDSGRLLPSYTAYSPIPSA